MSTRGPHRRVVAVALTGALLLGLPAVGALAVPSQGALDAAQERSTELDRLVADAETELVEVRAELDVLEGKLGVAEQELAEASALYDAAAQVATDASDRARSAEVERFDATAELTQNRQTLGALARDTYKYGAATASPAMSAFEMLDGPSEGLADRLHYLQRGVGVRAAALEASTALQTRVTHLTRRAQDEERALKQAEREADTTREASARLHAEVAQLTSETSDNLARSAELVATLEREQQDVGVRIGELETQVAREEEEAHREAERRAAERREAERRAAERREAERRERAEQQRRASVQPPARSGGSASSGGGSVSVAPGPSTSLRTVGGITVAASLAPQLEALLNHARRDGIVLGGSGYRSPEITARLRLVNGCPDVYESPASSCRIPTAKPGSSEHEKGLAVDFTYQGQTICFPRSASRCSGNAAFDWLRQNAGTYGLRNLPSEAWHWSTTGR